MSLWVFVFFMANLCAGPESGAADLRGAFKFQGTVTAIRSQADHSERSFTARNSEGLIKMFIISSLDHLEVGDRVELTYEASEKFPLRVTRVRFLEPRR